MVIQLADDKDFVANVRTIHHNDHDNSSGLGIGKDYEYLESHEGLLVAAKGLCARYVRLYSHGSTTDDLNRYTEVEVYGLPAAARSGAASRRAGNPLAAGASKRVARRGR